MDFSTKLRNVGIISTLIIVLAGSIAAIKENIMWKSDKKQILLLIRESEMVNREDKICQTSTDLETEYRTCMEKFQRERDIRMHETF